VGRDQRPRTPNAAERQAAALEAIVELLMERRRLEEMDHAELRAREPRAEMSQVRETPQERLLLALRVVPGFMQRVKQVPANFWQAETAGEQNEVPVARVRCPCGHERIVEITMECDGQASDGEPCRRFYMYLGQRLYVTGGPKDRRPPWLAITDGWRSSANVD
jgi:hypothetical protein